MTWFNDTGGLRAARPETRDAPRSLAFAIPTVCAIDPAGPALWGKPQGKGSRDSFRRVQAKQCPTVVPHKPECCRTISNLFCSDKLSRSK